MSVVFRRFGACASLVAAAGAAGQSAFEPALGRWGKLSERDIRVLSYNVEDAICSTNPRKGTVGGDWDALVRTIATLAPDIVLLQECGDNAGNGSGTGRDSVPDLTTTFELFIRGGADPFTGGVVTRYVQLYRPDLDYFIFVSTTGDSRNRNVILSRWPFKDLNGDGLDRISDVFFTEADSWNSFSGNGGIRGTQFAEIDLPDEVYAGDLVVGNSHLKAGRTSADFAQRREAAQIVAYNIYYWFGGAQTGTPDPNGKIADNPGATSVIEPPTAMIWGGDWNDDDALVNDPVGPIYWMLGGGGGVGDGTDRDGTDSDWDRAVDYFTGLNGTFNDRKIDYVAYWDSVASVRQAWVFNTATLPGEPARPEAFDGFPDLANATDIASDHRPVFADFVVALVEDCAADVTSEGVCAPGAGDGLATLSDFSCYLTLWFTGDAGADLTGEGSCEPGTGGDGVTLSDFACFLGLWSEGCG